MEIPRDRDGTFEPQLIPKHARRLAGFDDKVLALSARGLPVREIQKFRAEISSIDVSPDLISEVTDAVVAEVTAWQTRPLDARNSLEFESWQQRKALATALRPVYTAAGADAAPAALDEFAAGRWGRTPHQNCAPRTPHLAPRTSRYPSSGSITS